MKKRLELNGTWMGEADGLGIFQVKLPGTLDTNGIGRADEEHLESRLTRLHTYEGKVRYSRRIGIPKTQEGRLFLRIERTRELSLEIDGCREKAFEEGTLSTPWLFEVTKYAGRDVELVLVVDNYFTNWPRESVIGASAVTDETQTNWNGVLGDFAIYEEKKQFFHHLRIYPTCGEIELRGDLFGLERKEAEERALYIRLASEALEGQEILIPSEGWLDKEDGIFSSSENQMEKKDGTRVACGIRINNILLSAGCHRWDEEEGNLYTLHAELRKGLGEDSIIIAETDVEFGVRVFSVDEGLRLTLNGRRFFLRGETNCCVFPEEGHPPMTEEEWHEVLEIYASYGVNCMRFHSWCPPEAAFTVADKLGMMMQPELSQWNFKDAFKDEKARAYYQKELYAILKTLANHPSFVMLTFGNELQYTKEGDMFAESLLDEARAYDKTRLYANSSNYHYGEVGTDPGSDFYTSMAYYKEMLRATSSPMIGHLNHEYPSSCHTYEETVWKVHQDGKPVFEFEVGQYEVLPEFSEIEVFQGVTRAVNLEIIREKVQKQGMLPNWERYVEATGELAYLCYREEVEATLRTEGMSGLSLLGLQDFPGQGTALIGMLNSHLQPKPYAFAQPQRFREFFGPIVPLLYLEKYTYWSGEMLTALCRLAHYGKEQILSGAGWELKKAGETVRAGVFAHKTFEPGSLADVGEVHIPLPETTGARQFELCIYVGEYKNSYPIWIYAREEVNCPDGVTVSDKLTVKLLAAVEEGETVFLEPEPVPANFPASIGGQFTTDFWSVGTFPEQEGGMGMVIDSTHPALSEFPTEFYCNYQWWPMAGGRPMILPGHIHPIVTVPDSYSRLKHMGLLFEASLGKGRIMVSSMGLLGKQQYPECRGLLRSLLHYLGGKKERSGQHTTEDYGQCITREEMQQIIAIDMEPESRE